MNHLEIWCLCGQSREKVTLATCGNMLLFFLNEVPCLPIKRERERERERESYTGFKKGKSCSSFKKKREKTGKEKVIPKLKTKNIRSFKSICVFYQQKKKISLCKNICLL